jgi:hypothetical protein
MEVHKHPHHVTHKKKWTEYLLEFFMLFFAVFLGFVAENIREGIVENHREKQFINSLINDIKADTAKLRSIISSRDTRDARLDSMLLLLNSAETYTKDIYFIAVTISRNIIIQFTPNDGTMQQLKNAGGLRLIRKHWVADSIVRYDVAERSLERIGEQEKDIANMYRETAHKVLNSLQLNKMTDADNNPTRIDFNPPLEAGYKQFLNEFNYRLVSVKNVNKGYRREAKKLFLQATNLLSTFKKEYNLE